MKDELNQWRNYVEAQIRTLNLIESITADISINVKHHSVSLSVNPDWFDGTKEQMFEHFRSGVLEGQVEAVTLQNNRAHVIYMGRTFEITLITNVVASKDKVHNSLSQKRNNYGKFTTSDSGPKG